MSLVRSSRNEIEKYEPTKGLQRVAVAEAAERFYRRAKDATKLQQAVELKLTEQRKFVLWWDANGTKGRPKKVSQTPQYFLKTLGVDEDTLHRWRIRLKDATRFATALQREVDRAIKLCEYRLHQGTKSESTEESEWYTPAEYLERVRDVFGGGESPGAEVIELDPASSDLAQARVKARRYFTRTDDGLKHVWQGRVFLNPPYTQPAISDFVEKLVWHYRHHDVQEAILLTHNYTDTAWFHNAVSACSAICFTRGRIAFLDPYGREASPTQGQAFFYYGDHVDTFRHHFEPVGFLVFPL